MLGERATQFRKGEIAWLGVNKTKKQKKSSTARKGGKNIFSFQTNFAANQAEDLDGEL